VAFNTGGSVRSNFIGGTAGGGGGMFDIFNSGPANAPIKPPKVRGPNPSDYPTPGTRPVIGAPNRSDFSSPEMDASLKHQQGNIDVTRGDVRRAASGFNDPTHTSAFANLMGLADSQTSSTADEARRQAQENTSRAGYAGGFQGAAKQAALDKMKAVAGEGFAGAAQIRKEEGDQYQRASESMNSQINSYNQAETAMNTQFGQALAARNSDQAHVDLGFAQLVQTAQLGFADAKAKANELQAQLDEQFNNSMIDNAKYNQMSRSLAVEWQLAQQKIKEQAREFDVGTSQGNLDRAEKQREFDKNNALGFAGVNAQQLGTQNAIATQGRRPSISAGQAEDTRMQATLAARRADQAPPPRYSQGI
jgi:hypothetical protein